MELDAIDDPSLLYRRVVESTLDLGFDRAALFLYDEAPGEIRGTWGTDLSGRLVDESDYRETLGRTQPRIREALESPGFLKVWEQIPLTHWSEVVGLGWNAMLLLGDRRRVFGWLALDNALSHQPLSGDQRQALIALGEVVSRVLQSKVA